ncbi:MAG: hypothetical protein ACREV7_08520 [Steroidobacteraceae bacterium]
MSSSERPPDPPFAADAGIRSPVARPEDGLRELDDLMVVVEALCPRWPAREPCAHSGMMRL